MKPIALVSGGFDPLHVGHIRMFIEASKKFDLIVSVNSDEWLIRKKGFRFQSLKDRMELIDAFKCVSKVVTADDKDNSSVQALKDVMPMVFINGGDRQANNIPEKQFCNDNGIIILDGVGGYNKANSSSAIVKKEVFRKWGRYEVILDQRELKVKRLFFNDMKSIGEQVHQLRDEFWFVESGRVDVELNYKRGIYRAGDFIHIKKGDVHYATGSDKAVILEVQVGINEESDIKYL